MAGRILSKDLGGLSKKEIELLTECRDKEEAIEQFRIRGYAVDEDNLDAIKLAHERRNEISDANNLSLEQLEQVAGGMGVRIKQKVNMVHMNSVLKDWATNLATKDYKSRFEASKGDMGLDDIKADSLAANFLNAALVGEDANAMARKLDPFFEDDNGINVGEKIDLAVITATVHDYNTKNSDKQLDFNDVLLYTNFYGLAKETLQNAVDAEKYAFLESNPELYGEGGKAFYVADEAAVRQIAATAVVLYKAHAVTPNELRRVGELEHEYGVRCMEATVKTAVEIFTFLDNVERGRIGRL